MEESQVAKKSATALGGLPRLSPLLRGRPGPGGGGGSGLKNEESDVLTYVFASLRSAFGGCGVVAIHDVACCRHLAVTWLVTLFIIYSVISLCNISIICKNYI